MIIQNRPPTKRKYNTAKQKMMAEKTTSKIPKTPTEKKRWIRARQIVAKETGRYGEKEIPWQLVSHIYKEQQKANKTATKKDVKKTKKSKAVAKYKTPNTSKKKKRVTKKK